ncbi:C4-dicarboxylate ABC transporter permease [Thioclava dalianensis]|uniref:TRAP transporter small permease protein n=1 Tax=Thioclava dalianensis TaxID=1185766 RepID=A0A074TJB8_9RHOB|nr:TRAP transporter small permease [Thioclava dalianensis]KEP71724.1 C4-dicarboxylate ABC transporter permease [Thioclava dalianensis]SFN40273.1 TRAP-type C4-dicarboxylate transport system, small permease component [Thioclava dalianensis]
MIARARFVLEAIAAGLVTGLILVTCTDVIGRYLLNNPLTGAYEITQVLLGALVFVAMPLTTARGGHVEVDLLVPLLPKVMQRALARIGGAIAALVMAYFAWRLISLTQDQFHTQIATSGLGIRLWYLGAIGVLSFAVSAVVALLRRPE